MNKYITPVLLTAALALAGCGKKEDQNTSSQPSQDSSTQAVNSAKGSSSLPSPVIAAIDVQKILDSSTAAMGIRESIEKKRAEIQTEMTKYEAELREKEKQLTEQSTKLSEADLQKNRIEFEKRINDVQTKLNVRKLQLETAFEQARTKVYDAFLISADKVSKDVGANIVLYKEQVVIANNGFDITDKVLASLNKDMPKVEVTYPNENEILKILQQSQS